ncbi:hypothetical protein ACJD0Z_14395 [Flavobacteriaceae bacterium M23B6Z8]
MKYPILNISIEEWNNSDIDYSIILLEEGVIYTSNENVYTKFFLNNKYIDSNGSIYKVVGRELPASWKKAFSFLPNFYKVKLRFEKTEESMQIADLKSHIIDNIKRFNGIEDFEANWLSRIKVATTFEQILKQ